MVFLYYIFIREIDKRFRIIIDYSMTTKQSANLLNNKLYKNMFTFKCFIKIYHCDFTLQQNIIKHRFVAKIFLLFSTQKNQYKCPSS